MVYTAKWQRILFFYFFCLFSIILFQNIDTTNFYERMNLWIGIIGAFCCFLMIFSGYRFLIKEDYIVFEVRLFGMVVLKRTAHYTEMKKIVFKRRSFFKGAVVRLKNRFSLPLFHFQPKRMLEDLQKFAEKNQVEIDFHKTF